MPTRIDCEYEVLKAEGFSGTISEKELAWLKANGAVSKNIPDAWNEFLTAQGQPTPGTLIDRRRNWLLGLIGVIPEVGSAWIDLWKYFWCDLGGAIGTPGSFSYDPFFTTPWGTIWTQRYGALNVEILYSTGDLWIKGAGWGPGQMSPWVKNGDY